MVAVVVSSEIATDAAGFDQYGVPDPADVNTWPNDPFPIKPVAFVPL